MAGDGTLRGLGVSAAILLTSAVAILSLLTGLANITVGVTAGPIAAYIPEIIRTTAGFTGTLTGFLMLLAVWALRRRLRVAWFATIALLPLTALQGIVQASVYSLPLVVLSLLALPAVSFNGERFDRSVTLSHAQTAAIMALTGTLAYGTLGSYALREEFEGIATLTDAFYFTIVTATTVGYGDISPLSQQARLFGVSLVVLGTASFAVALGSLLGPAIEARFAHALGTMTDTEYDVLEDHILVLGYGDLTEPLIEELAESQVFVLVSPDTDLARRFRDRDIRVQLGNPSDDQPLHDAGIEGAKAAIVATENDAEDAFAILTARELNPEIRIVAAATHRENIEKLRRAGADTVLSPAAIGGRLLVRSALGEEDIERVAEELAEDAA
jgi:voltage-gated potassium channel